MRRQDFEILEGEGFLFNIYNYLYLSDPLNQQQKIKVNIPDTILFKYGQPKLWYFTGKKGKVLAKRAENMKIKDIQTKFLKNINSCNIVARFFQLKQNKNGQQELELKYYNAEQFEQFITSTDLDREGYLQKFIQPRGKFNNKVKVNWTKDFCYFKQVINTFDINDQNFNIYQRALLNETDQGFCEEQPYRSKLFPQVMETLCYNIAGHIQNVNNFKHEVRNMELSFVLDQKDKLYLISADRIKTIDLQENNDKQKRFNFTITLPDFVKQTVLNAKYENEINLRVCPGCDKQTQIEKYEQVNLLEVIQAWKTDHIGNQNQRNGYISQENKSNHNRYNLAQSYQSSQEKAKIIKMDEFYQVPFIVQKLYPDLKASELYKVQNQELFKNEKIDVCLDCYMQITSSCRVSEDLKKLALLEKARLGATVSQNNELGGQKYLSQFKKQIYHNNESKNLDMKGKQKSQDLKFQTKQGGRISKLDKLLNNYSIKESNIFEGSSNLNKNQECENQALIIQNQQNYKQLTLKSTEPTLFTSYTTHNTFSRNRLFRKNKQNQEIQNENTDKNYINNYKNQQKTLKTEGFQDTVQNQDQNQNRIQNIQRQNFLDNSQNSFNIIRQYEHSNQGGQNKQKQQQLDNLKQEQMDQQNILNEYKQMAELQQKERGKKCFTTQECKRKKNFIGKEYQLHNSELEKNKFYNKSLKKMIQSKSAKQKVRDKKISDVDNLINIYQPELIKQRKSQSQLEIERKSSYQEKNYINNNYNNDSNNGSIQILPNQQNDYKKANKIQKDIGKAKKDQKKIVSQTSLFSRNSKRFEKSKQQYENIKQDILDKEKIVITQNEGRGQLYKGFFDNKNKILKQQEMLETFNNDGIKDLMLQINLLNKLEQKQFEGSSFNQLEKIEKQKILKEKYGQLASNVDFFSLTAKNLGEKRLGFFDQFYNKNQNQNQVVNVRDYDQLQKINWERKQQSLQNFVEIQKKLSLKNLAKKIQKKQKDIEIQGKQFNFKSYRPVSCTGIKYLEQDQQRFRQFYVKEKGEY